MYSCVSVITTLFSIHAFLFEFIDTRVPDYARCLVFTTPLVGEFLTPLDLHVQILELEAYGFSWLLIRVAQWKRGSLIDYLEPFPSRPPVRLSSFPFVTCERLLYCSYLHISLYSYIFTY